MKSEMKTLTLSLKKKWFDLIKQGIKKEEYREINNYWRARFCEKYSNGCHLLIDNYRKKFDKLVFTLGYPRKDDASRRIEFRNPKILLGYGKQEWGAEQGKKYFVITWEK